MAEESENQETTEQTEAAEEAAAETTAPGQQAAEGETPEDAPAVEASAEPTPEPPVRDSGPVEGAPGEPGGSPAAEATAKKKRKRLPRAQRHTHSKPKRERPAQRKPIARLPKPESERGRRQERRGVVVSSAMDKTIVVKVDTIKAHTKYKKVVRRSVKFRAHDPENRANVGDVVRIVETRPISKTKNWRLAEIVEAAR
jgi:small subunit ribosomal protein S17